MTVGPRPKVHAMLQAGLPRCIVLVLMMLAYMNNIVTGPQFVSLHMECELLWLFKFCSDCPIHVSRIVFCRSQTQTTVGDLDGAEIFSGVESIARALRDCHFCCGVSSAQTYVSRIQHKKNITLNDHRFWEDLGMQVAVADLCLGEVFDVTSSAGFLQLGMATLPINNSRLSCSVS